MPDKTQEVIDLELQVFNLRHNLDMLGKALDEKDKLIFNLFERCSYITSMSACGVCTMKEKCDLVRNRYTDHGMKSYFKKTFNIKEE